MTETPTLATPRPDCDGVLITFAVMLAMADFRMAAGLDPDGSATIAHLVGRVGELARVAPAIRFTDTPAALDPAEAALRQLHTELRRLSPLAMRLARPPGIG